MFALLSLFSACLHDVVYKRYSRKDRSRGTYAFGIGVVWCVLQAVTLAVSGELLVVDTPSIRYGLFAGLCLTLSNLLLVEGKGIVIKILSDDNEGSLHQRFILKLHSGQTLLVTHNIDLAPRLSSLRENDVVAFNWRV